MASRTTSKAGKPPEKHAAKPPAPRRGGLANFEEFASRSGALARRSSEGELLPVVDQKQTLVALAGTVTEAQAPLAEPPAEAVEGAALVSAPTRPAATTRKARKSTVALPVHGTEGRLEASGDQVVKATIELAPQILHALDVWERDETRRAGRRVFRERVVDKALEMLPADVPSLVALVERMPEGLRSSGGSLFSTRMRASLKQQMLGIRPELRVAGRKDVLMRDVYTAALFAYLTAIGAPVSMGPPTTGSSPVMSDQTPVPPT